MYHTKKEISLCQYEEHLTSKAKKLLGYESQWPIETGYIKYIN